MDSGADDMVEKGDRAPPRCSGARCCLLHSFSSTATSFPNKVAVIHALRAPDSSPSNRIIDGLHVYEGDELYTFGELQSAVEVLAALLTQNLGEDQRELQESSLVLSSQDPDNFPEVSEATEDCLPKRVAIIMSHSAEYLVSIFAVMKICAAFVPVDPLWPSKKIIATLLDSRPSLLITSSKFTKLDAYGSSVIKQWLTISLPEGFIKGSCLENLIYKMKYSLDLQKTRSFCYIMYTSGSSGKPKGVCGTEKGLLNRLLWMESAYPYSSKDVGCFKTPIAFIDHLTESLGPLIAGVPLLIPCHKIIRSNPLLLLDFLKAFNITRLTASPSLLCTLLPVLEAAEWRHTVKLSILVSSGEPLSLSLWKSLQHVMPQTTILNLYGSTELAGDCTFYDCSEIDGSSSDTKVIASDYMKGNVPIGKPIWGCVVSIVTEDGSLAALGKEGELWVGGAALPYGYLNDAIANQKRFVGMLPSQTNHLYGKRSESERVLNQVRNNIGCHMFRTGDIVSQRADGNIIFVGRKDRMVKVYGQRVELREVEIALEQHPSVRKVAVLHCKLSNANSQLVAYVVPYGGLLDKLSKIALKCSLIEWLNGVLPSYMVPSEYTFLGSLPLTASGKVNYHSLSKSFVAKSCSLEPHKMLTENQELENIIQTYADVLMLDHVSVSDDFFMLGGTSISAAHVAYILNIDMTLIYKYPTPCALQSVLHVLEKGESSNDGHLKKFCQLDTQVQPISAEKTDQNETKVNHPSAVKVSRSSNNERKYLVESSPLQSNADTDIGGLNACIRTQSIGNEVSHGNILKRRCSRVDPFVVNTKEKHQKGCSAALRMSGSAAFVRCNRSLCIESSYEFPWRKSCRQIYSEGAWRLQLIWHCSLDACIDASPLLVLLNDTWRLYIGSHSHKFLCIDALSGDVRWGTRLGGRIESTAAVTQDFSQVVVGCYDGFIYFLDIDTGNKVWSFQTGGEVKCQPTLDTCQGLIWCGSYDHHLYALNSTAKKCSWQRLCEGSIFASPTIDEVRCTVYVAMTSGHILAILSKASFHVQWVYRCTAPVFGSVALDPSSGQVFCTVVDGSVIGLMPSGTLAWKVKIGGPVFAGACISSVVPSKVLVCSRDGYLYCLDTVHGHCHWKISLSEPITAAAWIDEEMEVIGDMDSNFRLVCVCTAAGTLHLLKVHVLLPDKNMRLCAEDALRLSSKAEPENGGVKSSVSHSLESQYNNPIIVLTKKFPGDIFSVPLMIGGRIFVGCRDDNFYCFDLLV